MTRWNLVLLLAGLGAAVMRAGPYLPPEESAASASADSAAATASTSTAPRGAAEASAATAPSPSPASTNWWRNLVRGYEHTRVGYTLDDEDEGFMDFTLSLQLPLFHNVYPDRPENLRGNVFGYTHVGGWLPYPYAAATVRAGQYIGTRDSSPVVGKSFNPLLSLRWWLDGTSEGRLAAGRFVELVYAHESNGQWIDDPDTFAAARHLHEVDGSSDPERVARDEISRGWDYVGLNFHWQDFEVFDDVRLKLGLKLSHFLDDGPLFQGLAEEYNAWENDPAGKPRNRVDGIRLRLDYQYEFFRKAVPYADGRVGLTWWTGIGAPLHYHTWEIEAGFRLGNIPLLLWYRNGYNSDLVDYYRSDESLGVRISLDEF